LPLVTRRGTSPHSDKDAMTAPLHFAMLSLCAFFGSTTIASASPFPAAANAVEETPTAQAVLPLRDRARLHNAWLAERLDRVVPALMREQGIDMWVLIAREYLEDPVVATMLDAESLHARRRTILIFYDPGGGRPVERLTVSRYGLAGLFKPDWNPEEEPDQWRQVSKLVAERQPKRIAVNSSARTQFADGLTLSQHDELMAALTPELRSRVVKTDALAVGWLETRTAAEMQVYPQIVRLAHAIIEEGLSDAVIRPGHSSADDVAWWFREKVSSLGLKAWFHPSVGIMRQGKQGMLEGDEIIQKGDLLWTDFGITYLGLNTDTQHLAYVLRDGERDAPKGLKDGLAAANAVQDALTSSFRTGLTGNEILAEARSKALAAGLKPSIYSHPIGFHGHGAGSSIGFWDNQTADPRGEYPLRANTAWSIELSAKSKVPEWNGQEVEFRLEEDAFFDGSAVAYLDGRQSRFHLIGSK
jgi:Xaa-Pro aminopeptidase